ncbi:7TM diverse intracellular signaling domain-containing protein [Arcobacter peruensis]|uniref:7TM diverse intracellular signaling domain-containing protein n=1 Tax=Arcobacter peruensis TaxID=2320140 RepID=UPI000F076C42|nr:7TM diverse intracellular signaling domain-containing protein [Arcobacter peruensis]
MKKYNQILLILIFLNSFLYANNQISISNSFIFIDKENLNIEAIKTKTFEPLNNIHKNFGFNKNLTVWLKIQIKNNTNKKIQKILDLENPLLEEIVLYSNKDIRRSGMLYIDEKRKTINPSFTLNISANSTQSYYVKIKNNTTALQFSIKLEDEEVFLKKDFAKQFSIILLIGVISSFLIYAMVLFFYAKDISYLYYSFYIIVLLFQQLTYIGLLPLYMPLWFTRIDNLIVVPKVGAVIIMGIVFARSFLKTKNYENIDKIYKYLIYIVLLQIVFISSPYFYYPEITVLTGLVFIFFNYYAAIYVYKRGNKQARFFIVGWSFLIIGFFLTIIDALGIYSIMYNIPILVLVFTAIEALFLLLAFVDKLNILQKQKDSIDNKLVEELHERNAIIKEEVENRTLMLKNLYRELHHRVKNNLQVMLSIIRLQSNKIDNIETKEQFLKLENRIKSISKTHEILSLNDDIEKIDMYEYIYSLSEDIETSYSKEIDFDIRTVVFISLKDAVYIGIIINELLTNSMKYSECTKISIYLTQKKNELFLHIADNGKGFKSSDINEKSLGLELVNSLAVGQLNGTISKDIDNKCEYNIKLKI